MATLEGVYAAAADRELILLNLVDFDMLWGIATTPTACAAAWRPSTVGWAGSCRGCTMATCSC